jgi:hypothetical protein
MRLMSAPAPVSTTEATVAVCPAVVPAGKAVTRLVRGGLGTSTILHH